MKKILIIMIVLLTGLSYAQPAKAELDAAVLSQANAMGKAFIEGRYEDFAQYTHPTIEIMVGSKERLVSEIKRTFEQLKSEGVSFTDISYGAPSEALLYEGQLQCTLPQMIEMKVESGTVTSSSILIAVSMDNGKSWFFIDPGDQDINTMRKIIPTLSPKLQLPGGLEPGFEPKEEKQ
ncbi:hypothetical protein [Flavobacterium sp.]|uniref:hypothetical protein n=1 Tax=Flavobacterium sp. TaxID=239 RepID=UPI00260D8F3F|nr:hypothetical protein [Flavobacterium sp.]